MIKRDLGTVKALEFSNILCHVKNNSLLFFNKINDIHYTSNIVNLSSYQATKSEVCLILKTEFLPHPEAPYIRNIFQNMDAFMRRVRLNLLFLSQMMTHKNRTPPWIFSIQTQIILQSSRTNST